MTTDVVRRQFETLVVFNDPGGRFRLEKVAPGTHRLRVEVEGMGAVEHSLEVGDGERVRGLVIEVGATGAFLLSDLSNGITAETMHVDGGYNAMGSPGRLLDELKKLK